MLKVKLTLILKAHSPSLLTSVIACYNYQQFDMVTVTQRCKKPLLGSIVSSQVSLLFSNIIGSKYKNGLLCNLFLAETQVRSQGLYHFRQNTHFPQNFRGLAQKSAETFSLQKILSQKAGILRWEQMEPFIQNQFFFYSLFYVDTNFSYKFTNSTMNSTINSCTNQNRRLNLHFIYYQKE